ncbi:ATP-binding protein [Myroides sp. JBRI-B21084]|uniref:ATP-binding protein n=1 Tax=Myroides sp. JBRI-B21084 TaxID=3119977 RepID=UPI0026E3B8C6|nr:ATP-binding protein [Paenimyroides cloacae]WKW46611.1 ATP-binding protein [Paenimyroides cloacae]
MKIKTKLISGVGLLFTIILLLSVISIFFIYKLKNDTKNILVANYNTLEYSRNMISSLELINEGDNTFSEFEKNLIKQQENITEIGEKKLTDKITIQFYELKTNPKNSKLKSSIRKNITEVMSLNMKAIERKSDTANKTAETAIMIISIMGAICFLTAFILLINLPGNIANPIKELTESIKQIANQNYKERVKFEKNNEFGELAKSFNTMAEKLEEYSESKLDKIIKSKKRIEALINNMHDPVIGLDENKTVLFANNEALKIAGLKLENLLGKPIQDIAIYNDLIRDLCQDIVLPQKNQTNKNTIKIFADNKESYFEKEIVEINITPTGENKSQFIGQVIMLKNITLFKELDFAKTNFIATVSHEFKTPIASIQMSLDLLKNNQIGMLNEEQLHLINSIDDDSKRLLKITGELLNMTQLESGKIQLKKSFINPVEIVNYAIDANKIQAEQKNIQLVTDYADNLPQIEADLEKTVWVVTNLISNAIRYSYENSKINISIAVSNNQIIFSVQDSGQGIPNEYKEKVFNRYFRVPGTKKGGTGLGLAISKEFIEAQGGTISVESELGLGSTFIVKFTV